LASLSLRLMDTGIAGGARALLLVGDTAKISGAGAPPTDATKSATVPFHRSANTFKKNEEEEGLKSHATKLHFFLKKTIPCARKPRATNQNEPTPARLAQLGHPARPL
jgi:hypothetical protein